MAFKSVQIASFLGSLNSAACSTCSVTRLSSAVITQIPVPALSTSVPKRFLAAKARVRSEEEKSSRKTAREETTAAKKQFPFLPTKASRQVYVLDKGLADEIASTVIKNQSDSSTPILEVNPGLGVVTKALLKAGTKQMVLTESIKGFMPYLQEVEEESNPRIRAIFHMDYLTLWRRAGEGDSVCVKFEESMTSLFPHRRWEDGPPVAVVAVVPEEKERPYLTHLITAMGRQHGLYSLGRPEWFLVLSPGMYRRLLVLKMEKRPLVFYSHLAIILHLLFDLHLCAQLPGWKFTPRFPEKRVSTEKQCQLEVSNSMRYLVHFRPRQDQPLSSTDVPAFHTFLRQLMQRKKIRLIPKMEQLVPGCGPHLIRLEVTMMTLVADLSPHRFLTIFKAMQTWPEYHGSPLKQVLTSGAVSMAVDDSTDQGAHKDGTDSSAPPAPVTERC